MGAFGFANNQSRGTLSICTFAVVGAAMFAAQSCSKTDLLTPLQRMQVINNQTQSVNVNFCTDPAVAQQNVVKMLIILDHSGSNALNYQMDPSGSGAPLILNPVTDPNTGAITGGSLNISASFATDPTGLFRYGSLTSPGTLLNYLSTLPAVDPTHYFALLDFSTAPANPPIPNPASGPIFTNVITGTGGFLPAVQTDLAAVNANSTSDVGSTDYDGALQTAATMIQNDINNAAACAAATSTSATCQNPGVQVASSYVIVFASDGSPITGIFGVEANGTLNTSQVAYSVQRQSNQTIVSDVQGIVAIANSSTPGNAPVPNVLNAPYVAGINLFTVYYYNPTNSLDDAGIATLQLMAKAGNGLFNEASTTGTSLNYNQFLPLARTIKYTLSDIFVTNSSVVWWTDGQLHADTDMDGLPDDVELAFGSNPNSANSFGYGVSDSVEYALAQQNSLPMGNHPPNYATAGTSPPCASIPKTAGVYRSSSPDGLNDCEKALLSDQVISVPDSNNDLVPDWLEFVNGVPFQSGAPSATTITQSDGVSAYQKIKGSLPAMYPLNQLLNLSPSVYDLTEVSTSPIQDCYNLVVTGLPVIGSQNTVRVDVIEKSNLLPQSYYYRMGKKKFPLSSQSVQFNDWNNAAEQVLGTWKTWQVQ
jgi:hypothetical protein